MVLLLSAAFFFKINFFQKILSGTLSECQTVWIQIRTNILLVLIWVQNVCKGYQLLYAFVVVCCFFSKLTFSKNSFRTFRVSNSLDTGLDLCPNCLRRLSADDEFAASRPTLSLCHDQLQEFLPLVVVNYWVHPHCWSHYDHPYLGLHTYCFYHSLKHRLTHLCLLLNFPPLYIG